MHWLDVLNDIILLAWLLLVHLSEAADLSRILDFAAREVTSKLAASCF